MPAFMLTFMLATSQNQTKWDVSTFLKGLKTNVESWLTIIVGLVGLIMVGVAIYQIASGLMSHGRKQTNWFTVILLFLIGGAFVAGGLGWAMGIAEGGKETIDKMGAGNTAVPETIRFLFG